MINFDRKTHVARNYAVTIKSDRHLTKVAKKLGVSKNALISIACELLDEKDKKLLQEVEKYKANYKERRGTYRFSKMKV